MHTNSYETFFDFVSINVEALLAHVEESRPVDYSIYSGIAGTLFKLEAKF